MKSVILSSIIFIVGISALHAQCTSISSGDFELDLVQGVRPLFCFETLQSGSCRANLLRYYYDYNDNTCKQFRYKGCDGNGNRFFTKKDCEEACHRKEQETSSRSGSISSCKLEIDMLGECALTSNNSRMALCGAAPLGNRKEEICWENSCCWHHSYKICYNTVVRSMKGVGCRILYSNDKGFIGMGIFQSDARYEHGWTGYLTFSTPITGNFCMLKDKVIPQKVIVGDRYMEQRGVILQGTKKVYEGQNVPVLFVGTYGDSKFDANLCEVQPKRERKS